MKPGANTPPNTPAQVFDHILRNSTLSATASLTATPGRFDRRPQAGQTAP